MTSICNTIWRKETQSEEMAAKEEREKEERERTEWNESDNMAFANERNHASSSLAHDFKG